MGDLQRASVQRSAAQPAARVRELPARARQAEREPIARPLRRMLALRALQPQLAVGAVDDPFEREAERTADAVTSTDPPRPGAFGARPLAASLLRVAQRALGKGETPAKKDEDEKTRKLQKKPAAGTGPEIVPRGVESQIQAMSAGGDPLTPALRSVFEPRFGYDFSSVRTHSGSDAAGAAVALGARAFTVGDHIYFAAGEYQPASPSGQRLIAHELTHTIQQKPVAARVQRSLFGDARAAVLERIRRWARELPPYELLTVLLGRDPITQQAVERSGVNILHAALRLVPNGQQIFEDMRQSGSLERAAAWFDAEIARLNLTWQGIRALFTQAWDAISPLDFLRPSAVWERIRGIFGPPFERLRNFAAAVGRRILDFIKERVLQRLRAWAQRIPGYRLLTFILRQDPFTDEPVPRTPVTFVRAVLDLVPGGERIFQNLERTRTIERTMEWLRGEIARLDLTWNAIKGLFLRAWNAFSVTDLLRPLALIERIAGIFAEPARRVARFALAVGRKVLEFIFEGAMALAGPLGQQVMRIVRRAGAVVEQIVADPVRFVHNLISALRLGFSQFRRNIVGHLRTALIQWLVGALEGAGIQLPERWDLRGILSLVLQVLGITWQRIRQKIVRIIGEERMRTLERVFDLVQTLITRGPLALWERIVEALGNFWELVIGGIRQWAITRIVEAAVTRLLTLFNPAGAIIQAIIATYNTIKFFVERIRQIAATVEAIVESIARIAAGVLGPAANAVERAMARTLPLVLDFLARLIGLGDVGGQIRGVIEGLQQRVDRALDRAVDWVIARGRTLSGRGGTATEDGDARAQRTLTLSGASHTITARAHGGHVSIIMASFPEGELRTLASRAEQEIESPQARAQWTPDQIRHIKESLAAIKRLSSDDTIGGLRFRALEARDTRSYQAWLLDYIDYLIQTVIRPLEQYGIRAISDFFAQVPPVRFLPFAYRGQWIRNNLYAPPNVRSTVWPQVHRRDREDIAAKVTAANRKNDEIAWNELRRAPDGFEGYRIPKEAHLGEYTASDVHSERSYTVDHKLAIATHWTQENGYNMADGPRLAVGTHLDNLWLVVGPYNSHKQADDARYRKSVGPDFETELANSPKMSRKIKGLSFLRSETGSPLI